MNRNTFFSLQGLSKVAFSSQRFLNPVNVSSPKSVSRLRTERIVGGHAEWACLAARNWAKGKTADLSLLSGFPP